MIVVTGAAGFIGSSMIRVLNNNRIKDVIAVDNFSNEEKNKNLEGKQVQQIVDRNRFFEWLDKNHQWVQFILHMGARSATTGYPKEVYDELNLNYTKTVWLKCVEYGIPLIYASSAATYGLGEFGYIDSHEIVFNLQPLNDYGRSKNDFDKWALVQNYKPVFWAGLKFFNVYGPNEYHKERMASVVYHSFNQIKQTGKVKLFKSHNPKYPDGGQIRDFIYVKDVCNAIYFLMQNRQQSGIYNIGTGKGRTFYDLALNTFKAMDLEPNIEFIPTPEDLRDKYQYFTEANMEKLLGLNYPYSFHTLEEGIEDYVKNYLIPKMYY